LRILFYGPFSLLLSNFFFQVFHPMIPFPSATESPRPFTSSGTMPPFPIFFSAHEDNPRTLCNMQLTSFSSNIWSSFSAPPPQVYLFTPFFFGFLPRVGPPPPSPQGGSLLRPGSNLPLGLDDIILTRSLPQAPMFKMSRKCHCAPSLLFFSLPLERCSDSTFEFSPSLRKTTFYDPPPPHKVCREIKGLAPPPSLPELTSPPSQGLL